MKLLFFLPIIAVALAGPGLTPIKKFRPAILGATTTTSSTTTFATTPEARTASRLTTTTTAATTTLKAEQFEPIRRCTLAELDGCKLEAANNSFVDDCTSSCRFHLEMIPQNNDKAMTCFGDATRESELLFDCLNKDVEGLYTEPDENVTMIRKPNYAQLAHPFQVVQQTSKFASPLVKKARSAFAQFRDYQKCVTTCLRDQTVACFERQNCGLNLPGSTDIDAIFQGCQLYKNYVYESARNACRCLAFQYKVKDLVGTCAFMGPVQMKLL
ncbi:hypothetical protein FO519_006959 [Halicephalobus sp. NKZ332]|nr:hypothetical protein FO519_006959 [Halicephalobus sp. NKZ332]